MAERPVFVPATEGARLVHEVMVSFKWHAGMAPSQKKKNVAALHSAAAIRGITPLLEISSKSDLELGRRLSAFSLKLKTDLGETTIESAFQGSKVFERGGPFTDLYRASSRDAKRDPRLAESGHLVGFRFDGTDFPLSPSTVFYDWLYLIALWPHREWLKRLASYAGFTDIEFNPSRSINCQARSCAAFVALERRGTLDDAVASFESYRARLQMANI